MHSGGVWMLAAQLQLGKGKCQAEDNNKINLNTATKEQLTQLNGIGDKKAELIISYRDEHGKFKTIDELRNVSGIGDKTFAAISDKLTV